MNLRQAAEMALDSLDSYRSAGRGWEESDEKAFQALRAALTEPDEYTVKSNGKKSAVLTAMMNNRTKREAALAEADEPPRREPLADWAIETIAACCVKGEKSVEWALRAVERAHGIGAMRDE